MQLIFRNTLFFILIIISCAGSDTSQDIVVFKNKINGLSFVASKNHVVSETIKPVLNINANWVALMPFGFIQNLNNPNLAYNANRQWWGEKLEGVKEAAKVFKQKNVKSMLKPQIWVRGGSFTGNIKMNSETDWQLFETKYESFILAYAKVAAEEGIEMFCIGTELNGFVVSRPVYWRNLILKIRKIYKGKLTYAANWDTYQNPEFWEQLDFIGIDAYFPLSDKKTPSVNELIQAWAPIKKEIHNFSSKKRKPIIFTEFGYRSIDYTARKPWDSNFDGGFNIEAQQNSLNAIFDSFWMEDWFQGGFLWKWFDNYSTSGGNGHKGYTIQNKNTEKLVKERFKK
jgi:hypothetical protein